MCVSLSLYICVVSENRRKHIRTNKTTRNADTSKNTQDEHHDTYKTWMHETIQLYIDTHIYITQNEHGIQKDNSTATYKSTSATTVSNHNPATKTQNQICIWCSSVVNIIDTNSRWHSCFPNVLYCFSQGYNTAAETTKLGLHLLQFNSKYRSNI